MNWKVCVLIKLSYH